jgi:hypothetical protein
LGYVFILKDLFMSDIRQKIYEDIEDYNELCVYFSVAPKGQIDYKHFTELKIKMQKQHNKK